MMAAVATGDHAQLTEEDRLRADMYEFLAALLRAEPADALIGHVAALQGDGSAIGSASRVAQGLSLRRCRPSAPSPSR